jgi:tripartite-type tricarboxylate transporter receptor subunit TctC
MRQAVIGLFAVLLGALGQTAHAQDWPAKTIRIVVPWPAGGSADIVGRLLADRLTASLRQNVVVENRPGASGMIGSASVAHSDADGYSFLISGIPSHVVAPATTPNPGFDPVKDFSHIAYIGGSPIVIVAHKSLGVTSVAELLALARRQPDALGYVSAGVGSLGNLVAEFWAASEKIKLAHVPYKGGAQAVTDLVAGHVKLGSMTWSTASPHIRSGTLVPLAVTASRRMAEFPNVPTFKEVGHGEMTTTTWWAFSGPPKLPAAIVTRLNRDINAALDSADIHRKLDDEAIVTEIMSPEEFTAFVASEVEKWGPVAKTAIAAGG